MSFSGYVFICSSGYASPWLECCSVRGPHVSVSSVVSVHIHSSLSLFSSASVSYLLAYLCYLSLMYLLALVFRLSPLLSSLLYYCRNIRTVLRVVSCIFSRTYYLFSLLPCLLSYLLESLVLFSVLFSSLRFCSGSRRRVRCTCDLFGGPCETRACRQGGDERGDGVKRVDSACLPGLVGVVCGSPPPSCPESAACHTLVCWG